MGRVCPPLRLTMVMLRRMLVIREGRWLPPGRDDGRCEWKVRKEDSVCNKERSKERRLVPCRRGRHGRAAKGTI